MAASPVPPTRKSTHLTPFLILSAGTLLAGIGNGIAIVALPWLVLERTGSATSAALVAAAAAIPLLFASLLSGTIVDIVGRRRIAIASDALSAISVMAIPLIDATFGLTVASLAILAALGAVFDPAGITARETMLPEAARTSGLRLDRVNSIYEAIFNGAYLIGPGLGGLLVATIGAVNTLWFTGAGFVLSMLAISGVRLAGAGKPVRHEQMTGFWQSTKEGLVFVWHDHLLRATSLLSMGVIAFYLPIEGVILPAYFTKMQTPSHLGWVLMAMSGGGLLGALSYGQWAGRISRRSLFITALITLGVTVLGLALLPPLPIMLLLSAIMGFAYGPVGPITNYAMQTRTPDRLRGRITGVMSSTAYAAGPAGYLLAGPLIDHLGIQPAFLLLASLLMLMVLTSFFISALRQLDIPHTGDDQRQLQSTGDTEIDLQPVEIGSLYPTMPLNHPGIPSRKADS